MHLLPNCHSIFRPLRLSSYLALLERSASPYSYLALFERSASPYAYLALLERSASPYAYLALLERSVLFHALIVLDGLGGDGGGDLAGIGYLGVGSR